MTEQGKYLLSLEKSGLTMRTITTMYRLKCEGFTYEQIKKKVPRCKDMTRTQLWYRFVLHERYLGIN